MKKIKSILMAASLLLTLASCERVAPNYYGVLMENYGKNGKADYSKQQGRVNTLSMGTELFQVPAFEQRSEFTNDDGTKRALRLKAADNTEFSANPLYSYKAIENRVVDLVFQNSRLGSGDNFMKALEDNVLEPHIYDLIKEESRKYVTDTLMANGGSLKFENKVQDLVRKSFEEKGLELITFSANLDFSDKVKAKIDSRNEVNTNVSVIDQQIIEQRKRNELAALQRDYNLILSEGITPQLLQQQFIEKWDGVEVLKSRNVAKAFHFIDTPYFNADQGHYKGYTAEDLKKVLEFCVTCKGKFLLCNYNSDLLEEYVTANGWQKEIFTFNNKGMRKNEVKNREVMVYNYAKPNKNLFEFKDEIEQEKIEKEEEVEA